jgi:hypothetical protein
MQFDRLFTENRELLINLAKKYICWEEPEEALKRPYRIFAQTMDIGSIEDCQLLVDTFGSSVLSCVLEQHVPGWFSKKSWSFWHRVLDLRGPSETVPPIPERKLS